MNLTMRTMLWLLLLLLPSTVVALEGSEGTQLSKEALNDELSWHHHNKTDNSCSTHGNCFECSTSSSLCHWCLHDNACHAKGSIHGCLEGWDCVNHTHPHKDKNETSCASHKSCSECALSSSLCHWCAHDQACHSVASPYGCVSGVNCYSNDRCRRTEPEPIDEYVFPEMGIAPLMVILFLGSICFCCSTLGYCVAGGVKGAYDDLAHLAVQSVPASTTTHTAPSRAAAPAPTEQAQEVNHDEEAGTDDQDGTVQQENGEEEPLVGSPTDSHYHLLTEENLPVSRAVANRQTVSRHMNCLFTACTMCYVLSLLAVGGFVLGGIRYFPKVPQYNICNDNVAWKSLVDSMTSMKVQADIEILISVMNPNHFDVDLDMGKGTFKHDGVYIGSFEIPPATVTAMSISDLMMVAKFAPDKWEALSLSAEYYRGTLVLDVDSQVSIRVPALADYSYQGKVEGMPIHVGDSKKSDRHLCACPQWGDVKNKTKPF